MLSFPFLPYQQRRNQINQLLDCLPVRCERNVPFPVPLSLSELIFPLQMAHGSHLVVLNTLQPINLSLINHRRTGGDAFNHHQFHVTIVLNCLQTFKTHSKRMLSSCLPSKHPRLTDQSKCERRKKGLPEERRHNSQTLPNISKSCSFEAKTFCPAL